MALWWKMICSLGDPMSLRHPVHIHMHTHKHKYIYLEFLGEGGIQKKSKKTQQEAQVCHKFATADADGVVYIFIHIRTHKYKYI